MKKRMIKENQNIGFDERLSNRFLPFIKFTGFYESKFAPENLLNDGDEMRNYNDGDYNFDWDSFDKDFVYITNEYLNEFIKPILKERFKGFKNLVAVSIDSPKEYNYRTDELDFDLIGDETFVPNLIEYFEKNINIEDNYSKDFKKYLTRYDSRDGFISFMPNILGHFEDSLYNRGKYEGEQYKAVSILMNYIIEKEKLFEDVEDFYMYVNDEMNYNHTYSEYIIDFDIDKFNDVVQNESKKSFHKIRIDESQLLNLKNIKNINDFDKIDEKVVIKTKINENKECGNDEKIKMMTTAMKEVEEAVGEKFFDFKSAKCVDNEVVATVRIVDKFYKIECENINEKNPEFEIELKDEDVFEGDLKALISFVKKQIEMNEAWYNTKEEKAAISEIDRLVSEIQKTFDVTLDKSEINMFKDLEKINTNKISLDKFLKDESVAVDEKINQLETAMNNAKSDKYDGYILYVDGVLKYVSYKNLKYKTNIPGTSL